MKQLHDLPNLLPRYAVLPLLTELIWNSFVYYGARLVASHWPHYIVELSLDKMIPFLPWTVSIYYASFLFWTVNYILCARLDKQSAYRFLSADFLAKAICLVCFLVFPTTNVRPDVESSGFWNMVMRFLYQADAANNLFPSIHCLTSWFCYLGIRNRRIPLWYQRFSLIAAFAIFISTLTTKQHVVIDVLGGVLLASFSYWFTGHSHLPQFYGTILEKIGKCRES